MAARDEGCAGAAAEKWGQLLLELSIDLCHKQTTAPLRASPVISCGVPLLFLAKGKWLPGLIQGCI